MSVLTIPSTFRRRVWMTEPESLLLSSSPIRDLASVAEISRSLGIAPEDLLTSRMCTVSLPFPEVARPVKGRFWEGIKPEALWHPLAWLPPSTRDRRTVVDAEDGGTYEESDDAYAIRIATTLMASNLYNANEGTWADVLSLVEIDITQESDQRRVQAWLAGNPDSDLDSLDISSLIDSDADNMAMLLSEEPDTLILAGMYRAAFDLAGTLDSVLDPETNALASGVSFEEAKLTLHLCGMAAMYSFAALGEAETDTWRVDTQTANRAESVEHLVTLATQMRRGFNEISSRSSEAFGDVIQVLSDVDSVTGDGSRSRS